MPTVRIAVAGAGLIGRRHVELVRQNPRCELAAVVDPAPEAAAIADPLGIPHHRSLDDLFAAEPPRPDLGVIIATPNTAHVAGGLACVTAGVPVLVEKPIADTEAEARELVTAAERADVPLLVGHHRRHSPLLQAAREVVEQGHLGRLVAVMGSALFYKPDGYFDAAPWRRERGGGPILINLIHEIDVMRMICGDIVEVSAMSSTAARGFPVEDTVALTLRFANGALGSFMLSDTAASTRSWELTSEENAAYPHHPDDDCYVIAGTGGSLAVPTMRLHTYAGERSWWEPLTETTLDVPRHLPHAAQLDHFVDVVRRTAAPLVTGRDAIRTLAVTRAVDRAARTGELVRIPQSDTAEAMAS
jgi:predicted dehydrogenase